LRTSYSLILMLLLASVGSSAVFADTSHNSKLGNPRPKSAARPPADDYAKYYIAPSENSKQDGQTVTHIVISLAEQRLYAYHDAQLIAWSNVSTGKSGHDTPIGTFKITQKHIDHFSNKYNNAPMPYFMRLTDDGVGLHAGILPGYAASHGCIRLPFEMVKELYHRTPSGTTVTVIAGRVDPGAFGPFEGPSFMAKS
jgi:lipoprotein-anchoring transpeptidase ErfK/SrfK